MQAAKPIPGAFEGVLPGADLWTLMLAAIGQRIDSPAAKALIERIGARPLAPATPRSDTSSTAANALGVEIEAACNLLHRAYWPARKEGRVWPTYVARIILEPPFPGPLPQGLDWAMSLEALNALARKGLHYRVGRLREGKAARLCRGRFLRRLVRAEWFAAR